MKADWNLLDPEVLAWHLSSEPEENFVAELFALRSEAGTKSALDGLLLMLPAEDLPELRAYLTSITGITMPNNTPESVAQAVHQQLKTAVERRMASRRP